MAKAKKQDDQKPNEEAKGADVKTGKKTMPKVDAKASKSGGRKK